MSKPAVPKSIDGFTHTSDKSQQSDFAEDGYIVDGHLLRERFAFAGEVKLTMSEAAEISDFLEAIDMFMPEDDELIGQLSAVRGMIQNYLSLAREEITD